MKFEVKVYDAKEVCPTKTGDYLAWMNTGNNFILEWSTEYQGWNIIGEGHREHEMFPEYWAYVPKIDEEEEE